ncbi:MAG: leucine-rich repeat domain-containing protein, partial [Ruminococcus flavefaciens]|nr:leucine-rich repeat domain-containing protein [Ruminococcus flavefaciens]
ITITLALLFKTDIKAAVYGDFEYIIDEDGNVRIVDYLDRGWGDEIVVPGSINGKPVTAIGERAFSDVWYESVVLPDSITHIEANAFAGNRNLTYVNIPESVTSIGSGAFSGCWEITHINLPGGLKVLEENVFRGSGLSEIEIPDSVIQIKDSAFAGCDCLESVIFEDGSGMVSIGNKAFYDCEVLAAIDLPDTVVSIGDNAFSRCEALVAIDLPDTVVSIGDNTFSRCEALAVIDLPDTVVSIGDNAFSHCEALSDIVLPEELTDLGDWCFAYCSGLESVTFKDNVYNIGGDTFYYCTNLKEVSLPSGLTWIGSGAFYRCESLEEINIPNGVASIGGGAFRGCKSLTKVLIPMSVTDLGEYAFCDCTELKDITIEADLNLTGSGSTIPPTYFGYYSAENSWAGTPDDILEGITIRCRKGSGYDNEICYDLFNIEILSSADWRDVSADFTYADFTYKILTEDMDDYYWWDGIVDGTVAITGYTGTASSIRIPGTCKLEEKTYFIVEIAEGVFESNEYIEYVSIAGGDWNYFQRGPVKIGDRAFKNCVNLRKVSLADGIISEIGDEAFSGCASLSLIWSTSSAHSSKGGIERIGNRAFKDCPVLKSIAIWSSAWSSGSIYSRPLEIGEEHLGFVPQRQAALQ